MSKSPFFFTKAYVDYTQRKAVTLKQMQDGLRSAVVNPNAELNPPMLDRRSFDYKTLELYDALKARFPDLLTSVSDYGQSLRVTRPPKTNGQSYPVAISYPVATLKGFRQDGCLVPQRNIFHFDAICDELEDKDDIVVDNQHKQITGYRDLTTEEIAQINKIKSMGPLLQAMIEDVSALYDVDNRWVAIAKTHFQEGASALIRSIARPDSFI